MNTLSLARTSCALALFAPPPPAAAQSLTQVLGEPLTRNLDSPTFVTSWPGNADLLVVVERGSRQVTVWDTTAYDEGESVLVSLDNAYSPTAISQEFVGVTGVAFHPQFLDGDGGGYRYVYVRWNRNPVSEPAPVNSTTVRTFVTRYYVPTGKTSVQRGSATTIFTFPSTATGHGSGTLQFDSRPNVPATLYVPMPDDSSPNPVAGGDCCRAALAQSLAPADDIGRLLSIDVDATGFPKTIEAIGLRNPFGFSVDAGSLANGQGAGDVWIGDTGALHTGSVIRWIPGSGPLENYGWPWRENDGQATWMNQPDQVAAGCNTGPCPEPTPAPVYTLPFEGFSDSIEFPTGVPRDAIIGGHVYRQATVSSLQDRYVFAIAGAHRMPRIYSMPANAPSMNSPTDESSALGLSTANGWTLDDAVHAVGMDTDGELLLVRVNELLTPATPSYLGNGSVWKVTP